MKPNYVLNTKAIEFLKALLGPDGVVCQSHIPCDQLFLGHSQPTWTWKLKVFLTPSFASMPTWCQHFRSTKYFLNRLCRFHRIVVWSRDFTKLTLRKGQTFFSLINFPDALFWLVSYLDIIFTHRGTSLRNFSTFIRTGCLWGRCQIPVCLSVRFLYQNGTTI